MPLDPLTTLRKAATYGDRETCRRAIQAVIDLNDPGLWGVLLHDVVYDPQGLSDDGEKIGDLIPGRALYALRPLSQRKLEHVLRALIAGAPPNVTRAVELREAITTLCVRGSSGGEYPIEMSVFEGFPRLTRLLLREVQTFGDLSAIARAPALQRLRTERCDVTELRALGPCLKLESLDLESLERADLESLAALPALRSLRVRSLNTLDSLDGVTAAASLESLTIDAIKTAPTAITSLGALSGSSLHALDVHGLSALTDLTALASMPSLRSLALPGAKSMHDLGPLAACAGLRALDLRGCSRVADLAPIAALEPFEALLLAGTQVKKADVPEAHRAGANHRKDASIRRAQIEDRRARAKAARPDGLHLSEWPTWPKLEALLFGKEIDNVDLGVELAAALQDPRLFEAMLYGVRWKAPAERPTRALQLDPTLAGLTPDESSELRDRRRCCASGC